MQEPIRNTAASNARILPLSSDQLFYTYNFSVKVSKVKVIVRLLEIPLKLYKDEMLPFSFTFIIDSMKTKWHEDDPTVKG